MTKRTFPILLLAIILSVFSCKNEPKTSDVENIPSEITTPKKGEEVLQTKKTTNLVADIYNINPTKSILRWKGSKAIGQAHHGTVKVSDGRIAIVEGRLVAGEITVDMASIATTDDLGDDKAELEGHLKSSDFFNVEKFPFTTFVFQKIQPVENPQNGFNYSVSGPMTIKGVTKVVTIPANLEILPNNVHVTSPPFALNRTEFGVKYGSGLIGVVGDRVINDNIELSFDVMFDKQP